MYLRARAHATKLLHSSLFTFHYLFRDRNRTGFADQVRGRSRGCVVEELLRAVRQRDAFAGDQVERTGDGIAAVCHRVHAGCYAVYFQSLDGIVQRADRNIADRSRIAGNGRQHNCGAVRDLRTGNRVVLVVLHDAAQFGECSAGTGTVFTGDDADRTICAACATTSHSTCQHAQCCDTCDHLNPLFHFTKLHFFPDAGNPERFSRSHTIYFLCSNEQSHYTSCL